MSCKSALARPDAIHCTDEAQAVEALGFTPRLVTGNPANLKITYPDDLMLAAAIMAVQRRSSRHRECRAGVARRAA